MISCGIFIELDNGKILTGNPDQFDGKNIKTPWVSGSDFPQQNQSIEIYPIGSMVLEYLPTFTP